MFRNLILEDIVRNDSENNIQVLGVYGHVKPELRFWTEKTTLKNPVSNADKL